MQLLHPGLNRDNTQYLAGGSWVALNECEAHSTLNEGLWSSQLVSCSFRTCTHHAPYNVLTTCSYSHIYFSENDSRALLFNQGNTVAPTMVKHM